MIRPAVVAMLRLSQMASNPEVGTGSIVSDTLLFTLVKLKTLDVKLDICLFYIEMNMFKIYRECVSALLLPTSWLSQS